MEIFCENLFNKYKNQIYSLCLKLTRDKNEAEDLFGDTWVKINAKLSNIKEGQNEFNWIYTVCLNTYRKNAKRNARILKDDFKTIEEQDAALENIYDKNSDVEKIISDNEEKAIIKKAINKLDDKYRIPLILFYYKDCSYTDVATIMKLPLSTVKYRLSFAKEKLAKSLKQSEI